MRRTATGRLGRVIFARLAPGDDVYKEIIEIVKENGIRSGVVLDLTGAATRLRVSLPKTQTAGSQPPQILEVEGLTELLGTGIIGHIEDEFVSGDGEVRYVPGEPYAHVHVSATVNGATYTGHLVEGTLVRGVIPQSHFTIAIAEVEGVDLSLRVDTTPIPGYPKGVPYHALEEVQL